MAKTAILNLPLMHSDQAQKEIVHNEALTILDALIHPLIQAIGVKTPPTDVADGQLFIIGQNPKGEFKNHAGEIAQRINGNWRFIKPIKWMKVTLDSDGSYFVFDGKGWVAAGSVHFGASRKDGVNTENEDEEETTTKEITSIDLIRKDNGEYLKIRQFEEEVKLQGKFTETAIKIPHHSTVLAVTIRVIEPASGASSFSVGTSAEPEKYGSTLVSSKDTTNIGLTSHPTIFWDDTPIRITAKDGAFTGGTVKVTLHIMQSHGPWDWD